MSQNLEAQYMSPTQHAFLAELYDGFDKIPINNHSKFLQSIYEIWFAQWPEHDVYPGDTHRELIQKYFIRRKAARL
ncbi:uncharacterized protein EDB91DRAFT_1249426 [Suillus paluster]|uniref:uncharacterized protein n=1 Tax=Suillus paluster TaxID=48578 RepID=UPI001B86B8D6|nr:uncharacterized protein EDB91DRAFT_1249426 [Suillus paluster]KAG1738112.1 hypothetical protein EDB91DRAFT_1249426 [Suillus paluster]